MSIKVFKGIDFDDILILPKVSEVFSRTQVNLYEDYRASVGGGEMKKTQMAKL